MKYVCDACSRLVTVGPFEVREDALVLTCPVCGAESVGGPEPERHAPVLELARPRPPPQGPLCPKCGAPRDPEREDCARCGLVYALFKPETFALPEPLEARWRDVEKSGNDPAVHQAFVDACASAQMLPEAVRRYRLMAELNPNDALAARFRDEVINRLMVLGTLPLKERPADKASAGTSPWSIFAVVVLAAAMLAVIYYFNQLSGSPLP